MQNNMIDLDDESSECEELILKSRIVSINQVSESENEIESEINEIKEEFIDNLDEMIILEISLTSEDFNLLKDNKIIIGEGENCILILNDLIKNCKDKKNNNSDINDKLKFIYGFIMGLIYSKHIKK
jgi:hypothetical protein